MTIRMPFPADVNPDPDAKYPRGMADAFPLHPHLSIAPRRFPVPNRPGFWLAAALLVLISLALSGCSGAEAQERATSASPADLKRAAASVWNCPGMHAEWLSDTTVQCLKERP